MIDDYSELVHILNRPHTLWFGFREWLAATGLTFDELAILGDWVHTGNGDRVHLNSGRKRERFADTPHPRLWEVTYCGAWVFDDNADFYSHGTRRCSRCVASYALAFHKGEAHTYSLAPNQKEES